MRYRLNSTFLAIATLAALALAPAAFGQAFLGSDWLSHRGSTGRQGSNADPGLTPPGQMQLTWVWPPSRDIPPEVVVDDTPGPNWTAQTEQAVATSGAWTIPGTADRAPGAWPLSDSNPDIVERYRYANPIHSQELADIGVETLSRLPNIGTDAQSVQIYRRVDNVLKASNVWARWNLGRRYPLGTTQGTRQAREEAGEPLRIIRNQRYAVYIRFPGSGTFEAGEVRPNLDHAMVRVSWGDNVDDPATSRIFMLNFGQTGGFWLRIRDGEGDDRYFPFGDYNIRVTLYAETPDPVINEIGARPIVPADAVRMVPEALRGDIHAPAASAIFPPGATIGTPGSRRRVYFGRDETTGPRHIFPTATTFTRFEGFTPIPLDPTKNVKASNPPQANDNPIVADPTSSIRNANFYCLEENLDATDPLKGRYGKLLWKYSATVNPLSPRTLDNSDPGFTHNGFAIVVNPQAALEQAYGPSYRYAPTKAGNPDRVAVWTLPLPPGGTYSIYAWIPGGDPSQPNRFAQRAHYRIDDTGSGNNTHVYLDQRNTDDALGRPRVGMWRQLVSGMRFEANVCEVRLRNDSDDDAAAGRVVVADAIMVVAESRQSNRVVAAPLIANVKWPSGTVRQVVYFATTDGRVWALDANGVGGTSALTTCYWAYPSLSNPDPAGDKRGNGAFDLEDDPNYNPDPFSNRPQQGIDGDLEKSQVNNPNPPPLKLDVYAATNRTPELGSFVSSPALLTVDRAGVPTPYIVIANRNGRVYAFDPAGRVDPVTNEPFAATIAGGNNPGMPGTTRRLMTWPTLARDKWLDKGGFLLGDDSFRRFADDSAKGFFESTASFLVDGGGNSDRLVLGSSDGHVYAVEMQSVDPRVRISNKANSGVALWQFPEATTRVDAITLPGVLTADKYIFSAGGRVYAIKTPPGTDANNRLTSEWTFPHAAAPGQPDKTGDTPPFETLFTAPAHRTTVAPGFNGGAEVVFVANRDGRVFALDASQSGNPVGGPPVLWESQSFGPTRASAVFTSSLLPQTAFTVSAGPGILLPLDTGALVGFSVLDAGKVMWGINDGLIGGVPVRALDANGAEVIVSALTSSAYRGADVITAGSPAGSPSVSAAWDHWVYGGNEGNQDTGELHGQFRAYASSAIGLVTPDEPTNEDLGGGTVDIRLVELWDAQRDVMTGPWDAFGNTDTSVATSPYIEWAKNPSNTRKDTQSGLLIYEWGDYIYAAAWGAYTGNILPSVTFRLQGGQQARQPITAQALRDLEFEQNFPGVLQIGGGPARAWVAKVRFDLGRGNPTDSQEPGRRYTVSATAQLQGPGSFAFMRSMSAGQYSVTKMDPNPAPGQDLNSWVGLPARNTALAHPFAISTRGVVFPGQTYGPAVPNIIGFQTNYLADNSAVDLTEILANGNITVSVQGGNIVRGAQKNVVAPLGLIQHGGSASYLAVDPNGARVPGFFIADRSNLYKIGQPLSNVRVDLSDLSWGWNPNDASLTALQRATGNAMNPLPWEQFPLASPNVSADYPDVPRARVSFQGGGVEMAKRGISLPRPLINGGNKVLQPMPLDIVVDMPRYQSANVNRAYQDLNGGMAAGALPFQMYAPMVTSTGGDTLGNASLRGLTAPSAGYYGRFTVYVDSNQDGRGPSGQIIAAEGQQVRSAASEVHRQLIVGAAVPPDTTLSVQEETLDLGKLPHSGGYASGVPFAPTGIGPYQNAVSPFDSPTLRMFLPFTVQSHSNVNLWNLRLGKTLGQEANRNNPAYWARLTSDQVESLGGVGNIWSRTYNLLGAPAEGNIGVIGSLDHGRSAGDPLAFPGVYDLEADLGGANFWPYNLGNISGFGSGNEYVQGGNVLNWPAGVNARPTLHKPRPGDVQPSVLSIPDVAYGDPLSVLPTLRALGREVRPKVGVAVPLGTPAGVYSAPIYVYEDNTPAQWRAWLQEYSVIVGDPGVAASTAVDNDGILNLSSAPNGTPALPPSEAFANPTFTLKTTVVEARLTNGVTPGSYPQIDLRGIAAPPFGANVQPTAAADLMGNIVLAYTSNRPNGFGPAPTVQDTAWFINTTQLNAVIGNVAPFGPIFDWRYEPVGATRWWNPLAPAAQFPDVSLAANLFPSQQGDVLGPPATPLIPGSISQNSFNQPMVRHTNATIVTDDTVANPNPPFLIFWQGAVYKNEGSANLQNVRLDSRIFYAPMTIGPNGAYAPDLSGNNGVPYSFLSDAALPKFAPKPLVLAGANPQKAYLFFHSGANGRTRLYYNLHPDPARNDSYDLTRPDRWSGDRDLNTPGALLWQSDPQPNRRTIRYDPNASILFDQAVGRYSGPYDSASAVARDVIDLVYTGALAGRRQAETLLTRYAVDTRGRLSALPLPSVENELLARQGATHTWASRDIAWLVQDARTRRYTDANNNPFVIVRVNGQRANVGSPVFDSATGKLTFDSSLGGQMILDPQAGTVSFPNVAPRPLDILTLSYTPQTARLNVTRNDTGAVQIPVGWESDPGYALRSHVAASGANSQPVSVMDRSNNPRRTYMIGDPGPNVPVPVTRLWAFHRKTGSAAAASATLYYKTMRLMVRLPRGVVRNPDGSITNNLFSMSGNRGPVELDWVTGALYFTEADEGNVITVTTHAYARDPANGSPLFVPQASYRVGWGDEGFAASQPGVQPAAEFIVPTESAVNEGQLAAFKDPFQDKVWLFWSSTRAGTTDLYYMTVRPQIYPQVAGP